MSICRSSQSRHSMLPESAKIFQRKMAKIGRVLAVKALANKLTKATYYIMRDQTAFDEDKLFQ